MRRASSSSTRARLSHALARLSTVQQTLRETRRVLRRMASLDDLTGLLNRRGLDRELRRTWTRLARRRQPLGLLVIDVDHFKKINDTHGHPAGDQTLKDCAALLRQTLRAGDRIGRYGGDEMIVLLPGAGPAETRAAATRIVRAARTHRFRHGRATLRMTLSIGMASACPGSGGTPDTLLIRADRALYRAKKNGRNRANS